MARSSHDLLNHTYLLLQTSQHLGIQIGWENSVSIPTKNAESLGVGGDGMTTLLPQVRLEQDQGYLQAFPG